MDSGTEDLSVFITDLVIITMDMFYILIPYW